MEPLFTVKCSEEMARSLGAFPLRKLSRPHLSFPVYEAPRTHHAELDTEGGLFAWFWKMDGTHQTIERM